MADVQPLVADAASGDKRKRDEEDTATTQAAKVTPDAAGANGSDDSVDTAAVLKQLTFYFSDSNLPRDKFLRELVRKGEEGWADFATIAKFQRMTSLCKSQDLAVLAKIVRDADSDFLEVSDDNTKIRRSPNHPLPAESKTDKQSIYVKGWDLKGTTIDSVEKYFADKGYKVLAVRLRRAPATKEFKGSTFVELSSVEEAQKCAADKHTLGDRDLLVEMKEAYHERKSAERKERNKQKKAESAAKRESANGAAAAAAAAAEPEYEAGCVLKFEGCTDETTREDLKEVFSKYSEVSWVDFQKGDTGGEIRFASGGAAATAKEAYEKEPVDINGNKPTLTVLEGDAEKAFWAKVAESKKQRYDKHKRNKGGSWGRKGGHGGGRWRGDKRKSGGGEGGSPKKARTD